MLHRLTDLIPKGVSPKPARSHAHVPVPHPPGARHLAKATYAKVFRWTPPDPHAHPPATVAIVGSFTGWRPVPLSHHGAQHRGTPANWQANIENIEGNKTHHYMLLVDGHPAPYPHSDGYAVPQGDQEMKYALTMPRGPRLFMLFGQTK